jgi:hypothetical protein
MKYSLVKEKQPTEPASEEEEEQSSQAIQETRQQV